MKTALLCEIKVLEFWELTPKEILLSISAYNERQKQKQEDALTLVYLNNAWNPYRTKRLPDLKKILGNEDKKEEMTNEEMFEEIKKMNSLMGGTVY
jgi:hypothetical protein